MENKKLTLGSLFDGSGGLLSGIIPVWASYTINVDLIWQKIV